MWKFESYSSSLEMNKSFFETEKSSNNRCVPSPPRYKDRMLHKTLETSKSSPNLSDGLDVKVKQSSTPALHKNLSTACVNSPPFMNPHKALIDLYNKYSANKGDVFRRSFSLRTKKMKTINDIYKYCNKENTFPVKIRKSSQGLGMCIYGGKDESSKDPFHELIRIWNLHPSQPALDCGKLTLGDVILEVNGKSLVGLTNLEAVEVLRAAPIDVELKIFRPSKYLLPSFPDFKESVCSENKASCKSNKVALCADNPFRITQTNEFEVTLTKRDGCLGFSIIRTDNTEDSDEGIFIKALTREHAIADGRILPGDRILQVNGLDISEFTHSEAISCLRNTPDSVTLKLCRSCNERHSCQKHSKPKVHTFNVTLDKSLNEKLGFCIWDCFDGSTPDKQTKLLPCAAEVKVVYPSSLAQRNGIKVGDRILEVNSECLIGKTADEVIDILRRTNGVIRMVFCRIQLTPE